MAIKVLAIMRRSCGTAAMTKAEPPKRIRKSLASKVRASPYAGGVIPRSRMPSSVGACILSTLG